MHANSQVIHKAQSRLFRLCVVLILLSRPIRRKSGAPPHLAQRNIPIFDKREISTLRSKCGISPIQHCTRSGKCEISPLPNFIVLRKAFKTHFRWFSKDRILGIMHALLCHKIVQI